MRLGGYSGYEENSIVWSYTSVRPCMVGGRTHIEHLVLEVASADHRGAHERTLFGTRFLARMDIREHILLAPFTTFKVGGYADYFCSVATSDDLRQAVLFARERSLPLAILGGGSNMLVGDRGVRGLTVKICLMGMSFTPVSEHIVEAVAGAGEAWDAFVMNTISRGLWGLENLSGIPGLVGATPIQNVGAYGVEIADTLVRVEAFDPDTLAVRTFSKEECRFGYRDSFFKTPEGSRFIITKVTFALTADGEPNLSYKDVARRFAETSAKKTPASLRQAILSIRAAKFPDLSRFGTAGSFFKNPILSAPMFALLKQRFPDVPGFSEAGGGVKVPAAWLIEHAGGFKGVREGSVGSFENQALVIVNYGGACAVDILRFADIIANTVREKTGITLEREVRIVGDM